MNRLLTTIFIVLLLLSPLAIPAQADCWPEDATNRPEEELLVVVQLIGELSNDKSHIGDTFNCQIIQPPQLENAILKGKILQVESINKLTKVSSMKLLFEEIILPDGSSYKVKAHSYEFINKLGLIIGGQAQENNLAAVLNIINRGRNSGDAQPAKKAHAKQPAPQLKTKKDFNDLPDLAFAGGELVNSKPERARRIATPLLIQLKEKKIKLSKGTKIMLTLF